MSILECDVTFENAVSHEKYLLKAGSPFLVMEYIPKNLYRFVEDHKTPESQGLPKSQVWTISRGMANGLMYLHSLNPPISHRDLKPDNILVSSIVLFQKISMPTPRKVNGNSKGERFSKAQFFEPKYDTKMVPEGWGAQSKNPLDGLNIFWNN